MRRNDWLVMAALLVSLGIYLLYRTERTLVNQAALSILPRQSYTVARAYAAEFLPLPPVLIFSLPEALWVFSITLTSRDVVVRVGRRSLALWALPMIVACGFEALQALHWIGGRFDAWDIFLPAIFWMIGMRISRRPVTLHAGVDEPRHRAAVCAVSYAIVYLAHVVP